MVLCVEYIAAPAHQEQLRFGPIASRVVHPDDGIGLFDAVPKRKQLQAVSHGLLPFAVEQFAARLGLLDPTRFELVDNRAQSQVGFLVRLYTIYVGRTAAAWRGGPTVRALQALDADEAFTELVKTLIYLSSDVMPDPVPMAAAIGITLDCWRNTELENLHSERRTLSDVVMAKLNVATTRAVRQHITTKGISWDSVGRVLLDPARISGNNGSAAVGDLLTATDWPLLRQSIAAKLDRWMHIEQLAGPEATLRLVSVMGSTSATERWWGNGWWRDYSRSVLQQIRHTAPDAAPATSSEFDWLDLEADLREQPEDVPDDVFGYLIDPPGGQGLRRATLPVRPVTALAPDSDRAGRTQ
jgi:hypothetical protein